MDYLPITVRLENKNCLLVGAGQVAYRKLRHLLEAGAVVTIVSPEFSEQLVQLAEQNNLLMLKEKFNGSHLKDIDLVISATNIPRVNQQVSELCAEANIWVNVVDNLKLSSFIMPAIVDRSPLLIAISTGGTSPVLARMIREKLEWLLPKNLSNLLVKLQTIRPLLKNTLNTLIERKGFSEWYLDRAFAEQIPERESPEQSLTKYLSNGPTKGKVYLVGAGPGDPELLTVKALKLLQKADIVLHDSLVSDEILKVIRKDVKLFDVGKRAATKSAKQSDINHKMVFYARQGLQVIRLKGGDPFIFGRGGEELEYLKKQHISFEVVPGITAAIGCASYAGIPLTHRDHAQSLMFITAHCKNSEDTMDWKNLARKNQTLVVYMGLIQNQLFVDKMIEHGLDSTTPFAIIENGTTINQRVVTGVLKDLPLLVDRHQLISPGLIIIGEVTKIATKLNWYQHSNLINGLAVDNQNHHVDLMMSGS